MPTTARPWTLPLSPAAFLAALTGLSALGAVATSIYVPSLPALAADLGTDTAMVQVTMTAFLIAFAIMQLAYGPLSDSIGRRMPLLIGLGLFITGNVLCGFAGSVEMLIAGRVVQAVGACAGPVIARAMIKDAYGVQGAAAAMSAIAIGLSLAPAVGPAIGGFIHEQAGWRMNFALMSAIGLVLMLAMARVPETLDRELRMRLSPASLLAAYRELLGNGRFLAWSATIALVYGGMFAYITGSPFLMIDRLGLSPKTFGALIIFNAIGFMLGSMIARKGAPRLGNLHVLRLGAAICVLGGGWLLAQALLNILTVSGIILGIASFLIGVGAIMPVGFAGAIGAAPRLAGAASGLVGFLHMTAAAVLSWLVAHINDASQIPMMGLIAASALLTLLIALLLTEGKPAR